MSLLLLALPAGPPGSYGYATSDDGYTVSDSGNTMPSLLPAAGRGVEIVAMVPASELSWHRVELPQGINPRSARLRATLSGLLEDKLLDDPEQLHFALGPEAGADGRTWVAVCRRAWLHGHLRALEGAERPVARIVPEVDPQTEPPRLWVIGKPAQARILVAGARIPGGVQVLPASRDAVGLLRAQIDRDVVASIKVTAEPAVAKLAEKVTGVTAITLGTQAQRLLDASHSPWNLAQLEFTRTGAAWAQRRFSSAWANFLRAPQWRPARWGLALLVVAQLAGLNLAARNAQRDLTAQRTQISSALTQTFPQVKVVVDAPLQMAREVSALQQRTGALSRRDFEPMLATLQTLAGGAQVPVAVSFTPGELRLKGLQPSASEMARAQGALKASGYRVQVAGDTLTIHDEEAR